MPLTIQSDKGKEFLAKNVQKLFSEANIFFRVARNPDIKAAILKRVIRTIKERVWRYFTHSKNHRYIDILQKVVEAYNNTRHSSIKMTPASVTIHNEAEARRNIESRYNPNKVRRKKFKYKVGDYVRISTTKGTFQKGYMASWSHELFQINTTSKSTNLRANRSQRRTY